MKKAAFSAISIFIILTLVLVLKTEKHPMTKNKENFNSDSKAMKLELAIENNDAKGVAQAVQEGADPDIQGPNGLSPLMAAVGQFKTSAAGELLRLGADPDITDHEGDSAVTLAVRAYKKDPGLLEMLINAGGNPNALFPDKSPAIEYFLNDRNFKGAEALIEAGADINALTRAKRPLIISHGIRENWDVVWFLIECGARYNYPDEAFTWQEIFSTPKTTPPDSPLWPFKMKVWQFLKKNNQNVPEKIEELK